MAGQQTNGRVIADINMTPLVDIMLVLLVIFIVTARIVVNEAVPVELPKAASGEAVQTVLAVTVPLKGPLLVDGRAIVDDAGIIETVRLSLVRTPELRAVIQGDIHTDYARVIRALDLLKRGGVTRIAFATDPNATVPHDL